MTLHNVINAPNGLPVRKACTMIRWSLIYGGPKLPNTQSKTPITINLDGTTITLEGTTITLEKNNINSQRNNNYSVRNNITISKYVYNALSFLFCVCAQFCFVFT